MPNNTQHQRKQIEVIDDIENQIKANSLGFSTVGPVDDYDNDPRTCLTSVHFPREELISQITQLVEPIKAIAPKHYYYRPNSLHLTIKNIRVINDPPHFCIDDIEKVKEVFDNTIPQYHSFNVYYYLLMVFPANLALVGTTDPELDKIILSLDKNLKVADVADDKKYANDKYFFSNITLMRFTNALSDKTRDKIEELSQEIAFKPYLIDSVSLITANASLYKCNRIKTWGLKKD